MFSVFVAFLVCWTLFNTSSLNFPEFVKLDPKYLNDLLPLISMVLFYQHYVILIQLNSNSLLLQTCWHSSHKASYRDSTGKK